MATNENVALMAWREMLNLANNPTQNAAAMALRDMQWGTSLMGYRADREPDASWYRPSSHRPPNQREIEYRRREEERILKMKNSMFFKIQKRLGGKEEDILKQMEEREKQPEPIIPRPSWSK